MIFKDLHIDGFGIFSSFDIKSLGKGVNILVGENEAGKSTLFKFLRFTLFGYPRLIDQRMQPLKGGRHGGRINAELTSGKAAVFERFSDNSTTLYYNGRESTDPAQWSLLLGNSTADIYNNVYTFTLDELAGLSSLSDSGVEDRIFSIGLGLGKVSIGSIESEIRSRCEEIYKRNGRNQKIPVLYADIQELISRIREIQDNLPLYNQLSRDIEDLESGISAADKELVELEREKNRLDTYLRCHDHFIILRNAESELEMLPEPQDYPEDGLSRLKELEKKQTQLRERINELKSGSASEKGIEQLGNAVASADYNRELLESEERVEYIRINFEKYKQTLSDIKDDEINTRRLSESIGNSIYAINHNWSENDIRDFTDTIKHRSEVRKFSENIGKLKEDIREAEAELRAYKAHESSLNARNSVYVLSAVTLTAAIVLSYYHLYIPSGALAFVSLLLLAFRNYIVKESPEKGIVERLSALREAEKDLYGQYENYLGQLGLSSGLLFDEALQTLGEIDNIKKMILERETLQTRVREQRAPFIERFEGEVSYLKQIISGKDDPDFEVAVSRIISEYKSSREIRDEVKRLGEEIERKTREMENCESMLDQTRSELDELLDSAGAGDASEFRSKYQQNTKVTELIKTKNDALKTIEIIAGYHRSNDVIQFLQSNEKSEIEQRVGELKREIKNKSQTRDDKTTELGEKRNEKSRIEGESELSERMTELETKRHNLIESYTEWVTGNAALRILEKMKRKYEKEKQPEVIKNSGEYFRRITGNRYEKITVSMDRKEVSVEDANATVKKIEQLSRGTKEQLLTSLRLGFIEEYEKTTEPLPVVVDEVLVNFDPQRAREMAGLIEEFAADRQVLVFTCHPSTAEYFSQSVNVIRLGDEAGG